MLSLICCGVCDVVVFFWASLPMVPVMGFLIIIPFPTTVFHALRKHQASYRTMPDDMAASISSSLQRRVKYQVNLGSLAGSCFSALW